MCGGIGRSYVTEAPARRSSGVTRSSAMSIYSPQEERIPSVTHRKAYALVSSLLMRKALNVTDSMTKSSSGKAKVQLSILTPNRASLLLLEGEAGFLRLMTMLNVGWTIASAGGGLVA